MRALQRILVVLALAFALAKLSGCSGCFPPESKPMIEPGVMYTVYTPKDGGNTCVRRVEPSHWAWWRSARSRNFLFTPTQLGI